MIHFISPLPLEVSARWLTLLEYLAYSLAWAWLIVRFTRIRKYRGLIFFLLLAVWGFVLNQNHYNLFPWTTIDSIFWIVMALAVYLPDPLALFNRGGWWKVALVTFFATMSALSRQTFALPALIIIIGILKSGYKQKQWNGFVPGLILGAIPGIIYLLLMIFRGSLPLMLKQLTGRSELIETGVISYFREFWETPIVWFYLLVIIALIVYRLTKDDYPASLFRISMLPVGRFLFAALFIFMGFMVFINPDKLFGLAYTHFWMLLMLWVFEEVTGQVKLAQRRWFFWALLIAWTSSISLGDNSPVFATGLLSSTGIGYILFKYSERGFSFRKLNHLQSVAGMMVLGLLFMSIPVQKNVNYRDVPSGRQKNELGELFSGFGAIRTNPECYSYMEEIKSLYQQLGFPSGRFVVLPNSPIIYPMLGSPNPMPLDWMQGAEFVGSEDYLNELIFRSIEQLEVFFLIDKYDSKRFADTLLKADLTSDRYPYMPAIMDISRDLPVESKWFDVRVTK